MGYDAPNGLDILVCSVCWKDFVDSYKMKTELTLEDAQTFGNVFYRRREQEVWKRDHIESIMAQLMHDDPFPYSGVVSVHLTSEKCPKHR